MKKRTSNLSRRIVSLLMSMVLTLTLVTPAAFATEVVNGSGTTIIEGNMNPADANPSGDAKGGDSEDDEIIADEEDADGGDSYDVQEDTLLGISLYAAAETWDGKTTDITWYDANKNEFEISTAAQLAGLAQLANDEEDPQYFADKTIKLMADIKLNDDDVPAIPDENADTDRPNEWMPIVEFDGTFDGNGHTISGLYVTEDAVECGLFAFAADSSTIQNLIVKGTLVVGVEALDAGGVVAAEYGVLRNCGFYGQICVIYDDDGNGCSSVGGVVGYIEAQSANVQNGWYYDTAPEPTYLFALGAPYSDSYDWEGNPNCFFDNVEGAISDGTAVEAMNANLPKGCLPWRMGTEHPEFLGETDRMVSIRPYVEGSGAEVMIDIGESAGDARYKNSYVTTADCNTIRLVVTNGCSEKIYVKSDLTRDIGDLSVIEVTSTGVEYTLTEQITTLYYGTADDFDSGAWFDQHTGEQSDPYIIRTAAQLRSFSRKAAEDYNFAGKFITLVSDIDLECINWDTVAEFDGIFDGGGYSISGLKVNAENIPNAGMFGKVTGTVRNLTVCGEVAASKYSLGYGRVGGIIGYLSGGAINNCVSRVTVTATQFQVGGVYVGGVVGYADGAYTIHLCENNADITADNNGPQTHIGGIAGCAQTNSSQFGNCHNCGNILIKSASGNDQNFFAGGIVGSGTADSCQNDGNVSVVAEKKGQGFNYAGGITGSGKATNSYNTAAVKGTGTSAGIVANPTSTIFNCYNIGDVTSTANESYGLGGIGTKNSPSRTENSYYVCALDDAEPVTMRYVSMAGAESPIIYEESNSTYSVEDDTLVNQLNKARKTGTPWFVNPTEGVYLPTFMLLWNGEQNPKCGIKTIYVTYEPNGGINQEGVDEAVKVQVTLEPDIENGGYKSTEYALMSVNEIGFSNENGVAKSSRAWGTAKDGGALYAEGQLIQASEDITLYAQWDKIWDTDGDGAYLIKTPDDLQSLQTQVNDKGFNYTDKWFRLASNIDLKDIGNWTPIGNGKTAFGGNLDGNNNIISGLNVNTSAQYAGLFGRVAPQGTSGSAVGTLVIKNLTVSGSVESTTGGTSYCGGVVGLLSTNRQVTFSSVHFNGTVKRTSSHCGGIIGRFELHSGFENTMEMVGCTSSGSIIGRYAGGLVGDTATNGTDIIFENCTNDAAVTGDRAGGLLGCNTNTQNHFTSCTNNGSIGSSQTNSASGIAAGGYFDGCTNNGQVQGATSAGISISAFRAENCGNTKSVIGKARAAGILINGGYGGTASFCYNIGEVKADDMKWAFGIAYSEGNGTKISNCFSYVAGKDIALAPNTLADGKVTNSYYLASSATAVSSAGTWASADDFTSGKVAWGVDGGTGKHENYWTQGANNYPVPIGEGTSTSYYRAKAECGTGGAVSIKSSRNFAGDADNAVYGMKGTSVTVTATPKDDTFGLKTLTLDLMGTGSTTALESGDSFTLGEANALVVAAFASTGNGGSGDGTGGNGGDGDGTGTDTGDGAGDENDEGLQDGLNLEVEYNVKGLVLAAYGAWGAEGSGKTFTQWLKDSPEVLRALITNSLDNMAVAAMGKKTDEAKDLAAMLLASLNEHSGLDGQSSDTIAKMLRKYIESSTEAAFSAWLTTGGGMASGTYESIFAQYTNSLLALADRLYTNWESSGTSLTFPQWLDAQQVTMESLSENAEEPDAEPDDTQTTEAPEDVPDGQEAEGGASSGGNSVWEVIGTVVRENPIIVWAIVAVVAALIIVGAVRRYHKVKRDEHDDVTSEK